MSSSIAPHHASHIVDPSSRRSTAPIIKPHSAPSTDQTYAAQKYSDPDGSVQDAQAQHERQFSSTSLEHSLQELDRNLQDMLMESGGDDTGRSHVAEWLKESSEETLPPEETVDNELQIASPISIENTFNYSPVSVKSGLVLIFCTSTTHFRLSTCNIFYKLQSRMSIYFLFYST